MCAGLSSCIFAGVRQRTQDDYRRQLSIIRPQNSDKFRRVVVMFPHEPGNIWSLCVLRIFCVLSMFLGFSLCVCCAGRFIVCVCVCVCRARVDYTPQPHMLESIALTNRTHCSHSVWLDTIIHSYHITLNNCCIMIHYCSHTHLSHTRTPPGCSHTHNSRHIHHTHTHIYTHTHTHVIIHTHTHTRRVKCG